MGYYTRVLSRLPDSPSYDELVRLLRTEHPNAVLSVDAGEGAAWSSLVLSHAQGPDIAAIERNVVGEGTLAAEEISEFIEEIQTCRPASAVAWLTSFLKSVKVIYAFQHLSGTVQDRGDEMLRAVSDFIWSRGEAIMQADGEGFSNEDGYHILWQFSDNVSGPWWMAVHRDGKWVHFEMDLGKADHRKAFLEGRVPPNVKTA